MIDVIIVHFKIDLLDSPTWLSMVDELWNNSDDDDSCTLKALCRMNRLALEAPGSVGMAVSISRYEYKNDMDA